MSGTRLLESRPPKVSVKIANFVFISGITISFLVVFYSVYRIAGWWGIQEIPRLYVVSFFASAISIPLFSLALRLGESAKVNIALVIISSTFSIILTETYLTFNPRPSFQGKISTAVFHDQRSKFEVVDEFRSKGIDAYPNISGSQFISTDGLPIPQSSERIYPLGTISNKTTVYCNESGQWAIYQSDEHGFNNPRGLYVENGVEIMLTGDSFTEGACVNPDETIAAVLRKLGLTVISLGKGGNGPLLELASLTEYAVPLQPKVVLWIHYANDIDDLKSKGMKSSLLMTYLADGNFSQNLISRQGEIDEVLKDYVDRQYGQHKIETQESNITKAQETIINKDREAEISVIVAADKENKLNNISSVSRIIGIVKFTNLRVRLGLRGSSPSLYSPTTSDTGRHELSSLAEFRKILRNARGIVSRWDGKLYLIYLHAYERYSTGEEWQGYYREHVLRIASELNIPVIDAHKKIFVPHPDPLSLFPGRKARHYNAEGYRLIAEAIAKRLRSDGLFK